jgi:ATP/maltotriose-dependent transcriptional regulator MalT
MYRVHNQARSNLSRALPVGTLVTAWLDRATVPLAIVDRNLDLVWANRAAHQDLEEGIVLELRDDRLRCRSRNHHAVLAQLVIEAAEAVSTAFIKGETEPLLLRAVRIGDDEDAGAVGLRWHRLSQRRPARFTDLDVAFGLTPTEHKILLNLCEGSSATKVAEDLNVSMETVRSHIRGIYIKLNVCSREEMFACVQPFRL